METTEVKLEREIRNKTGYIGTDTIHNMGYTDIKRELGYDNPLVDAWKAVNETTARSMGDYPMPTFEDTYTIEEARMILKAIRKDRNYLKVDNNISKKTIHYYDNIYNNS